MDNILHAQSDPARWHLHCLDAWRELHAERAARIEAERDRIAYRELAQEAIHALADLTDRFQKQSDQYHALLAECRASRQQRAA